MDSVFVSHNELGHACIEELVSQDANIQAIYTREQHESLSDQTTFEKFDRVHDINVHHVRSLNTSDVKQQLRAYAPDLLFVIGWSELVDTDILSIPSVTAVGMHPAPLPRGRGRAPLAWSLIKGLDETALSMFHLVEEADAGDLIGQEPIPIDIEDDAQSLYQKMVAAGRQLINTYYPKFEAGTIPREPQEESQATWWPKREPHHGLIDWRQPPQKVYDWIRGQTRPYPGAFSYIKDLQVTVWKANPPSKETVLTRPGEIVYQQDDCIGVGVWEGVIEITEIEVETRDPVPAAELINDYDIDIGDKFETARTRLQ